MSTEPEIREELADERRELKQAVDSLRAELGHAAERGKKAGAALSAATGVAVVARVLLALRKRK